MKNKPAVYNLFRSRISIINIGLESLSRHLASFPVDMIQVEWKPPASAKLDLIKKIQALKIKN